MSRYISFVFFVAVATTFSLTGSSLWIIFIKVMTNLARQIHYIYTKHYIETKYLTSNIHDISDRDISQHSPMLDIRTPNFMTPDDTIVSSTSKINSYHRLCQTCIDYQLLSNDDDGSKIQVTDQKMCM